MSSIDLVILGIVLERPQSAYDIQKDVAYHQLSRWTRISVPSVYKKVLSLKDKGYLQSTRLPGERAADKAVYAITRAGIAYFEELMDVYVHRPVSFTFDFNVVITNLNKLDSDKALTYVQALRDSVAASAQDNETYAATYADIPLVGRTVFDQQRRLYRALLDWLDAFETQLRAGT